MGKLSTHVLDTARGIPAEGIKIELFKLDNEKQKRIKTTITNSDGRTDELLLDQNTIEIGEYMIVFLVEEYLINKEEDFKKQTFLSKIPIRFWVSDINGNYHIPLLFSPWSYSTYRGS